MAITAYGRDPEEVAFELLFPFHDKNGNLDRFRTTQAMTEIQPRMRGTLTVLDVLRKEWNSVVIKEYEESFCIWGMPLERKARLEGTEIVAAGKMMDLKQQSEY